MDLGMNIPAMHGDDIGVDAAYLEEYLARLEEYGFASAWMGEHIVRPHSFEYTRPEMFSALSYFAGITTDIELGSAILLLPLRNPVLAAKAAATVQWLSDGRYTLGVGLGYVEEDFEAVGVPYEERSARFTEGIELLRRLLHEDSVTFDGEFYQVEGVTVEPRLDDPPRILLAGGGIERDGERFVPRPVKERLLSADGWIATSGATPEMTRQDWADFADFAAEHGRDPDDYHLVASDRIYLVPGADESEARAVQRQKFDQVMGESRGVEFAEKYYSMGSIDDIVESLEAYEDVGFDQINLVVASLDADEIMTQLDLWGEHVLPRFA